jgi:flagellar assembly protein FliH
MSLSKVYRGQEFSELERFEFRSFSGAPPTKGAPAEKDKKIAPPAAPPPTPTNQQEVSEAHRRGRQEGSAAVEAKLGQTIKALTEALEEVSHLRETLARNSSQDMLRMVMAISEQVIRRALEADPQNILALIENALQASIQSDYCRIRLNPQDLDLVKEHKPLFLASVSGLKNISFDADPTVSAGGCKISSDFGDVDATIESQLEEIRKALQEIITGPE